MPADSSKPTQPTIWCRGCGYVLDGLDEHRCPECGRTFDPSRRWTFRRKRLLPLWIRRLRRSVAEVAALLAVTFLILFWRPLTEFRARSHLRSAGFRLTEDVWTPTYLHAWFARWAHERSWSRPMTVVEALGFEKAGTDEDVRVAAALPNNRVLLLDGSRVTDIGLAELRERSSLRDLFLRGTAISDGGLVHVGRLSQLTGLNLAETSVTDSGIAHLEGLADLTELSLNGTAVGDDALAYLKQLPRLTRLSLRDTKISDAGVGLLSEMRGLVNLDLGRTALTDNCLADLCKMTNLLELQLIGTNLSDTARERLVKSLSATNIHFE